MYGYCVYILSDDDHIISRTDIFCDNDDAAREKAKKMVAGYAIELWQGARKIAKFVPGETDRDKAQAQAIRARGAIKPHRAAALMSHAARKATTASGGIVTALIGCAVPHMLLGNLC